MRLATIRMLRAAVQNADIAAGRRLDEQGIIEVLARELKLRREALDEYRRAGRAEQVAQLEQEIQVVQGYLPEPLSEAEIAELARQAAAAPVAQDPPDTGPVPGAPAPPGHEGGCESGGAPVPARGQG
ncbi:MAG: hypothetical protein DIU84_07475, partial [Bacillota bacterium]